MREAISAITIDDVMLQLFARCDRCNRDSIPWYTGPNQSQTILFMTDEAQLQDEQFNSCGNFFNKLPHVFMIN